MRGNLVNAEIRSDRIYHFPMARSELWRLLGNVESYPDWWPWMKEFDAKRLRQGELWRCTIQPPLPYTLQGQVRLAVVIEPELIEAELTGDIAGWATLAFLEDGDHTQIRLHTELSASSAAIRVTSRTFPSLARWGHDWVLDTAARQLMAALALDKRGSA
jgi:hypothetical protein